MEHEISAAPAPWEAPELREESIAGATNFVTTGTLDDAPEFFSTGTPNS